MIAPAVPTPEEWPETVFAVLIEAGVWLFAYVPDAGNKHLIELADAHPVARTVLLTTEEEGIALCAGADLVGKRAILCMQSSGVGNCPNFLTLAKGAGFPILMMVSMRGGPKEQNPWQKPMGEAVEPILHAMGVATFDIHTSQELGPAMETAIHAAFETGQAAALVLTQTFLGVKQF